ALSATERGPHRLGTSLPGEEVTMSDAGAGTSRGGSQGGQGQQADPGRKYGIMMLRSLCGAVALGAKRQSPRFFSPHAFSNQG
ncbi:unnamed protein product, partial [Brassica rapa subsp. narinosa]